MNCCFSQLFPLCQSPSSFRISTTEARTSRTCFGIRAVGDACPLPHSPDGYICCIAFLARSMVNETVPVVRKKRSDADRKKHAGWRTCPRCRKSVSTNGRNYFHHMHKCDPAFFAAELATFIKKPTPQLTRIPVHVSVRPDAVSNSLYASRATQDIHDPVGFRPGPVIDTLTEKDTQLASAHAYADKEIIPRRNGAASWHSSHTLPGTSLAEDPAVARINLTEEQRVLFVQQLCFLRTYDKTVDHAFDRLERASGGMWGVFNSTIFADIEDLQRSISVKETPSDPKMRTQRCPGGFRPTEPAESPNSPRSSPPGADLQSHRFACVQSCSTRNDNPHEDIRFESGPRPSISRDRTSPNMASPESINFSPTNLQSFADAATSMDPASSTTPTSSLFSTPRGTSTPRHLQSEIHQQANLQRTSLPDTSRPPEQRSASQSMSISNVVD